MTAKKNFLIDLIAFVGLLLAMQPGMTGMALHEWFSLALGGVAVFHVVVHAQWVTNVTRRCFGQLKNLTRVKYALDAGIFVSFTIALFSGLMISESVLPFFGLGHSTNDAWRNVHNVSAYMTMILIACHVAVNWGWVKKTSRSAARIPAAWYGRLQGRLSGGWLLGPAAERVPVAEQADDHERLRRRTG